jgi:hypothetical protein
MWVALFQESNEGLIGAYENNCQEKLVLSADSTFYYTYPLVHGRSWAKGVWKLRSGKLCLEVVPVLDTINTSMELMLVGSDSVYNPDRITTLEKPYTMLSKDTVVDYFEATMAEVISISCCIEQLTEIPHVYKVVGTELVKLMPQDYPSCKKLKRQHVACGNQP